MGALVNILFLILIVLIVVVFFPKILSLIEFAKYVLSSNGTLPNLNFSTSSNGSINQSVSSGSIINYTLSVINKDRSTYGLPNVTLSPMTSAQQHADSMLEYNYFSHWDIYGMKPYMRYALLGGKGAVQENVAYSKSGVHACIATLCTTYGNINVANTISSLEYSMMYNDSQCCNNGHRDNILNPYHNEVSLGVAYNSTTLYLVEDFINDYITWYNNTPSFNGTDVLLKGSVAPPYRLSNIEVSYDSPVINMTQEQLDQTSDYSYGQAIAGVVSNPLDYYPSLMTIDADTYYTNGNDFLIAFNMQKEIEDYGAGEYTVAIWLNTSARNSSFIGSTYTIFINSNGTQYMPNNV